MNCPVCGSEDIEGDAECISCVDCGATWLREKGGD